MSFIAKPKVAHPSLPRNELGLTRRDYEGGMSTLCAGCGHDSVTAAIIEAVWQMSMRPEQLDKFHRYFDKDGDGIPYRTLPGVHPKGAYFTRGSGHTQYGAYTEDATDY